MSAARELANYLGSGQSFRVDKTGGMATSQVGLKKDDPRFLGLAVAHASRCSAIQRCRESIDLGSIVKNPTFVMVKEATFGNLISSSGTLASANTYRFSSKEFQTNSA